MLNEIIFLNIIKHFVIRYPSRADYVDEYVNPLSRGCKIIGKPYILVISIIIAYSLITRNMFQNKYIIILFFSYKNLPR